MITKNYASWSGIRADQMQGHFCKTFRGWMGPELQIVVLDMSLEEQLDRVRKRHAGHESAVDMAKVKCERCRRTVVDLVILILMDIKEDSYSKQIYLQAIYELSEPAGEEEANTIDLKVLTLVLNMTVAEKRDFLFQSNLVFDQ